MKTNVFKKLCVALLLFCFANVYGQQNEKVKKLLKGLTLITQEQLRNLDDDSIQNLPIYNLQGDLIKKEDLGKYFDSSESPAETKYTLDIYLNKDEKPVLFLLRRSDPELESQLMQSQMEKSSASRGKNK